MPVHTCTYTTVCVDGRQICCHAVGTLGAFRQTGRGCCGVGAKRVPKITSEKVGGKLLQEKKQREQEEDTTMNESGVLGASVVVDVE